DGDSSFGLDVRRREVEVELKILARDRFKIDPLLGPEAGSPGSYRVDARLQLDDAVAAFIVRCHGAFGSGKLFLHCDGRTDNREAVRICNASGYCDVVEVLRCYADGVRE